MGEVKAPERRCMAPQWTHNTEPEMTEPDTISVIIPTFNRSTTIMRAINSVKAQTYAHIELIIVDDGSTDDTARIIAADRDKRIVYLENPSNRGISYSRNIGVSISSGNYIAFLDSDDAWHPDKLQMQYSLLTSLPEHFGLVYCGMTIFQADRTDRDRLPIMSGGVHRE